MKFAETVKGRHGAREDDLFELMLCPRIWGARSWNKGAADVEAALVTPPCWRREGPGSSGRFVEATNTSTAGRAWVSAMMWRTVGALTEDRFGREGSIVPALEHHLIDT